MTPRTLEALIETHVSALTGKPLEGAEDRPADVPTFTADDIAELEAIEIY